MTDLREERNKAIVRMYCDLREQKKTDKSFTRSYCIDFILHSEQNRAWCLGRDTIRLIVSDKGYGSKARRKSKN